MHFKLNPSIEIGGNFPPLEIDLICDDITLRRYEFYKKLAFYKYEYNHFQIPFRKDEQKLELLILSNNKDFTFLKYEVFISTLKKYL
ncbi:MAG: hypothetical protein HRT42_14060 [Campylobacteraceae bacterium]|nr:hypothetical protein [Campylobacteraceae bacterium]